MGTKKKKKKGKKEKVKRKQRTPGAIYLIKVAWALTLPPKTEGEGNDLPGIGGLTCADTH
eukprot:8181255-Lingulodinium_polyedra.AAC.1